MTTIYVLKCREGKYYVGKTDTFDKRYKEHLTGEGSAWTKKYRPIGIEKVIKGDKFDENKITKQYMDKYGIDNVRGGSYCQIKLDQASVASLNREMNGANDKCLKCGKSGHFAKYCKYNGKYVQDKIPKKCNRCNREGHTETQCYATTYEEEEEMVQVWICTDCNKEFDTKKGAEYHQRFHCHKKNRGTQRPWRDKKKSSKCKRCGRNSHYSNNCYASSHAKGYYLD